MIIKGLSRSKFEEQVLNEDACSFAKNYLAVSDGAGGGGIFAERWSQYLVQHITESSIPSFAELNEWIESIWEKFYNEQEQSAIQKGGMILQKFYDEGSFATLAAAWIAKDKFNWITYGDSVVFHYNKKSKKLDHSFTCLKDFASAPYLINWKDELSEDGFKYGTFPLDKDSILLLASDTLSQYILMMYLLCNPSSEHDNEINEVINSHFKLSKNISMAQLYIKEAKPDFEKDILYPLINSLSSEEAFSKYLKGLCESGLLGYDDYTLAIAINELTNELSSERKWKRIPRKLKKLRKKGNKLRKQTVKSLI